MRGKFQKFEQLNTVESHFHWTKKSRHPGELVAKVGNFGVKSAKVYRVQMGTKPAKVDRLNWPPVC
jgi:hypothetical protein